MPMTETIPGTLLARRLPRHALFALIVFAASTAGTSVSAVAEENPATLLPVSTMEIVYQDSYRAVRRFPGRINAAQVADLGFQVNGEIESVLVEVGDRVEKDQALARLDPERLELRRKELEAARAEASASLIRSEALLRRTRDLLNNEYVTQQDLDNATAERDGLRARVRQLDQSIENANVNLGDATLKAPFRGVIVGRYLDAGATVSAGQPVVRLNEKAGVEALIGVPARFARNIVIGDSFEITSKDLASSARVLGIGDEVELATQTVAIRLQILDDPGFIPGGLVRLQLEEERRTKGAWAPALALTESLRGLWSVYVVENIENGVGVIARKDVEVIHIGNQQIYIRGTVEEGDQVVASAPFRFVPGQRVRIVASPEVEGVASNGDEDEARLAVAEGV